MRRRTHVAAFATLALAAAPFACGAARPLGPASSAGSTGALIEVPMASSTTYETELAMAVAEPAQSFVDAGLKPPPEGRQLPEGGSLRREDASLVPEAAGMPDAITPPMVRDASIPEVGPTPLP